MMTKGGLSASLFSINPEFNESIDTRIMDARAAEVLRAGLVLKGLEQSLGFMVNYLYNLEEVEINHEKYVVDKKINTSKSLEKEFIKLNIEIG